jgi:hypothetical protein
MTTEISSRGGPSAVALLGGPCVKLIGDEQGFISFDGTNSNWDAAVKFEDMYGD